MLPDSQHQRDPPLPAERGRTDRCLICEGTGDPWTESRGRQLLRCRACGFAWVPQGVARTDTGESIYESDEPIFFTDEQKDYYRDEVTVDAARAKLAWVARFVPPGSALLDVGANFGHFIREAQTQYDAIGIEPSAAVVSWGREHLNVRLEQGSIETDNPAYAGRFGAVTMFDVIEHLPDPRAALQRCRRYLAGGGAPLHHDAGRRRAGRAAARLSLVLRRSARARLALHGVQSDAAAAGMRLSRRRAAHDRPALPRVVHRAPASRSCARQPPAPRRARRGAAASPGARGAHHAEPRRRGRHRRRSGLARRLP